MAVLGAGIDTREAQNVAFKVLVDGVTKLLADKSFSQNAKKIGDSFASAGMWRGEREKGGGRGRGVRGRGRG